MKRAYEQAPENYQLGLAYAKSLLQNRQFAECDALMSKLTILPYEGAGEGRAIYHETKLMLAIERMRGHDYAQALFLLAAAREWPERLGAGKPYDLDLNERVEDWLTAYCYQQQGKAAEASKLWQQLAESNRQRDKYGALLTAWALRKLGKAREADAIITEWQKQSPPDSVANLCGSVWMSGKPCRAVYASEWQHRVLNEWLALSDAK